MSKADNVVLVIWLVGIGISLVSILIGLYQGPRRYRRRR